LKSEKVAKLANYVRKKQLADGGWSIFEGGPSELNASVKAYVALRLAGDAATAPHIVLAKEKVIELGGIEATNSYVRFYLAMVGAIGMGSHQYLRNVFVDSRDRHSSFDNLRE
jgi:squalene-hopene/tetraprenyl-beta-curcumene cyclase